MVTFKQFLESISLKIGGESSDPAVAAKRAENAAKKEKAKEWIKKMYEKFQPNPLDGRQRVMVWEKGDDQELGIFELEPSMTKMGAVDVKWFQAYPLRQGVGSKAMAKLKELAKTDGVTLTLYPWDKGRVSQSNLIKFYKKMGFKPTTKGSKDMYWDPADET